MKLQKSRAMRPMMALLATALLATACSSEETITDSATDHTVTIRASIGQDDTQSRATVDLDAAQAETNGQKFYWSEKDAFNLYVMCIEASAFVDQTDNGSKYDFPFTIKEGYSNDNRSKTADFTGIYNYNTAYEDYGPFEFYALLPKDGYTSQTSSENIQNMTYTMPESVRTQIGNNTDHLNAGMFMYATATSNSLTTIPALPFKHLTSLVRFSVKNDRGTGIRLKSVKLDTDGAIFHRKNGFVLIDKNGCNETTDINSTATQKESSLVVNAQESTTDTKGLSIAAGATAQIYTLCLEGKVHDFKITASITVTDADGNNEITYTANTWATTDFAFKPGKRYWFDLSLDDKLTLGGVTVSTPTGGGTDLPGWSTEDETDIQ